MTGHLVLASLCAATAAALTGTTSNRERAHGRLRRTAPPPPAASPPAASPVAASPLIASPVAASQAGGERRRVRRAGASALAGLGLGLVIGGPAGVVLGIALGAAADRILRRIPDDATRARLEPLLADLPLCLDLVAANLAAGAPLAHAVEVVGEAVGGPLGQDLAAVGRALRLGAAPAEACRRFVRQTGDGPGAAPPARRRPGSPPAWWRPQPPGTPTSLAAFVRALERADDSGAHLATVLTEIADTERVAAHGRALEAARRVGVHAVLPLGLCFLPAFLAVGVIPVIAGAATHLTW
jgi:tight adherence protein B